jgi:hypothetical protein
LLHEAKQFPAIGLGPVAAVIVYAKDVKTRPILGNCRPMGGSAWGPRYQLATQS